MNILSAAMAMALASGYENHASHRNDFDANDWLIRNRERIEARKVRKQMLPKKQNEHRFKVTYSKGNPPKFTDLT